MNLPIIDLTSTLAGEDDLDTARVLVDALHRFGAVIVRDPRATQATNDAFIDLQEAYFGQPYAARIPDQREALGYQIGVSPPGHEKALDYTAIAAGMAPENRPTPLPSDYDGDPKERYMWPFGSRPQPFETLFPKLNNFGMQVIPAAFAEVWAERMDAQAKVLNDAGETVVRLIELCMRVPTGKLTRMFRDGPNLLAPNAAQKEQLAKVGTIINAFHNDIGALTVHGRSRFPALRIWLRNGTPLLVRVPEGCLLVQVGKQLEHISGGYFLAGYHEVVALPETLTALEKALAEGRIPIRVSVSFFKHMGTDQVLHVLPEFYSYLDNIEATLQKYPPTFAGTDTWSTLVDLKIATLEVAEIVPLTPADLVAYGIASA